MSAFTRMMEDYDYHQHTGELPEYFGKGGSGDKRGCGFGCFVSIILFAALVYATCSSDKSSEADSQKKSETLTVPDLIIRLLIILRILWIVLILIDKV